MIAALAGRARPRRRLCSSAALVVVGYLALALTFTLRTRAWENDDESSHVLYAEHLVRYGTLPLIGPANGDESHQSPLYFVLLAGWQTVLRIPAFGPALSPRSARSGRVLHFLVGHDYTRQQDQQAWWLHELRLFSVVCGVVTVAAAYALGWLLTRRTSVAAAVAACVAAWPKFLVISAAVTNSALVDALCACALPCWVLWYRSRAPVRAVILGTVLGAAVLTQVTALPLTALLLASVTAAAAARRDWRAPLLAVASCATVCGWWFLRNTVIYGDPLATAATARYLPGLTHLHIIRPRPGLSRAILRTMLPIVGHSTWYSGGWDELQLPHAVDDILWVLAAVSMLGVLRSRAGRHLVVLGGIAASVVAWLLIIRSTTHGQGRYLLTGVTAWSTALVTGAHGLPRRRTWQLWAWPAIFTGLDVYLIATTLIPYGGL